jgi:hypothetical protein
VCTNTDWAEVRAQGPPFKLPPACSALELMGVPLGDDGVALLAGLLPASPQLQRLELTAVGMGPLGAKHLAQALAPSGVNGGGVQLVALKVETCGLGDDGVEALADALAGNTASHSSNGCQPISPRQKLFASARISHAAIPLHQAYFSSAPSNPPLYLLGVVSGMRFGATRV